MALYSYKEIELSIDEARKICNQPESHTLDFKNKEIRPAKVEKIAVSFSNSIGGEVLLGIDDQKISTDFKKRWNGYKNIEECNNLIDCLYKLNRY